MHDKNIQWHFFQRKKKILWPFLSKAAEAVAALETARKAEKNAEHWRSVAEDKVKDLQHEISKQYEEKE